MAKVRWTTRWHRGNSGAATHKTPTRALEQGMASSVRAEASSGAATHKPPTRVLDHDMASSSTAAPTPPTVVKPCAQQPLYRATPIASTSVPNVNSSCYMSCIFIALLLASQVGSNMCAESRDSLLTNIWTWFVEPIRRFFGSGASQQPLNIEEHTVSGLLNECFENKWLEQQPPRQRQGEQCAAEFALFLANKMSDPDQDCVLLRQTTTHPDGTVSVCSDDDPHKIVNLYTAVEGAAMGSVSLDALFDAAFNASLEDGGSTKQAVVSLPKMVIVHVNRTKFKDNRVGRCDRAVTFPVRLVLDRSRCILCCAPHFLAYLHVWNSKRIPTHRTFWLQICFGLRLAAPHHCGGRLAALHEAVESRGVSPGKNCRIGALRRVRSGQASRPQCPNMGLLQRPVHPKSLFVCRQNLDGMSEGTFRGLHLGLR